MNSHRNFQARRDFLRRCSLAGLGVAAPICLPGIGAARGEDAVTPPYEGPYYVVFNASGGWDTTYLMDPKGINEMNRLYKDMAAGRDLMGRMQQAQLEVQKNRRFAHPFFWAPFNVIGNGRLLVAATPAQAAR